MPELLPRSLNQHTCNMRIKTRMNEFSNIYQILTFKYLFVSVQVFALFHGWKLCGVNQFPRMRKGIELKNYVDFLPEKV
nr:MAG TPA: hypothetical protein [Caudoviricetes sp.]